MIKIQVNNISFILDPDMELVLSANEENHAAETKWFNFVKSCHVAMVEEMKDPKNLGEFVQLLMTSKNAFMDYNQSKGRTFE